MSRIRTTAEPMRRLLDAECWALLGAAEVGRFVSVASGSIEVFPVNYALHQGRVYFRTDAGSKVAAVRRDPAVVFEVDEWNRHHAWSVVVRGVATVLEPEHAERLLPHLALETWAPGPLEVLVEITPHELSGRRLLREAEMPPPWQR